MTILDLDSMQRCMSPAIDKLFDKGYVLFSDQGEIIMNKSVDLSLLKKLGVDPGALINGLSDENRAYLLRHRILHGLSDS